MVVRLDEYVANADMTQTQKKQAEMMRKFFKDQYALPPKAKTPRKIEEPKLGKTPQKKTPAKKTETAKKKTVTFKDDHDNKTAHPEKEANVKAGTSSFKAPEPPKEAEGACNVYVKLLLQICVCLRFN